MNRLVPRLSGDGCVCLAGFGAVGSSESCGAPMVESRGCTDAFISEFYLTLAFPDRIESWDLQDRQESPSLSMEIKTQSKSSGYLQFNISYS